MVGSQCAALGELSFLPALAEELFGVLTDPLLGGCVPALAGALGPLLDPTMVELTAAFEEAFRVASAERATLLVSWLGHGEVGLPADGGLTGSQDFYLLPVDCPVPQQPTMGSALLLGQGLRELLRDHDRLDGLVLIVDACHAGEGALDVAGRVARVVGAAAAALSC